MLVFPSTIKYNIFIFDPDLSKDKYIQIGFKEVSIGQSPEQIFLYNDFNCILRQHVLRHYFTGTIHGAMGDTYNWARSQDSLRDGPSGRRARGRHRGGYPCCAPAMGAS